MNCSEFTVVLLSVGNNFATLPGRNANHKLKGQFLVLWEEESAHFERELPFSSEWINMRRETGKSW